MGGSSIGFEDMRDNEKVSLVEESAAVPVDGGGGRRDEERLPFAKRPSAGRLCQEPQAVVPLSEQDLNTLEIRLALFVLAEGRGGTSGGVLPPLTVLGDPVLELLARFNHIATRTAATCRMPDVGYRKRHVESMKQREVVQYLRNTTRESKKVNSLAKK